LDTLNLIKYNMGIGDWGLGPIPNPQSPISLKFYILYLNKKLNIFV